MKTAWVELGALWRRGNDQYTSAEIMDDRISDLFQLAQSGPVKIMIQPNRTKKSDKHPDAYLWAVAVKRKE